MALYEKTASELSELLGKKEISAVELAKDVFARTKAVEDKVQGYVTVAEESALAQAEAVDKKRAAGDTLSALAGIPIAIKDNICTKGTLTTCASKMLAGFKPPYNATVMEKLIASDAVITGKANMDEFAMGSSCENSAMHPTHNPHGLDRVPGGSSGGSAAVVAAGEAPLALGSDTGGSIRQPASFCGVVGMKPTYGAVSRYGLIAFASSLDQIGPFGRSIEDAAMLLDAVTGHDPLHDSTSVKTPFEGSLRANLNADVKGLKIGLPKEYFGEGISDAVRKNVMAAAEAYKALGAEVFEISLPLVEYALPIYYILSSAEASSNLARFDGVKYGYRTPNAGDDIIELYTKSKIYCSCSTGFGAPINTHTCPVCTGMPGALPVLNKQVVHYAAKMGKATGCTINQLCKADRKNYFYPDLPKAYQISQFDVPICENGEVFFYVDGVKHSCRLERIHFEEDAGKLLHDEIDGTIVDFNRCGVPLIEMVTRPDLHSSAEAKEFLEMIKTTLSYLDICDCKMEEGSIRCDVNVSIRPEGSTELGTRVEMKNINTFSGAVRAIDYEIARQIEVVENGGEIQQETRRWDDVKLKNTVMRTKEDAQDYRYFPDPDLIAVEISDEWLHQIESEVPELPITRYERYLNEYGMTAMEARLLSDSFEKAELLDAAAKQVKPKAAANWILSDISKYLNDKGVSLRETKMTADKLVALVKLIEAGTISGNAGKKVLPSMFETDETVEAIVDRMGLKQVSDEGAILAIVQDVIAKNEKAVADFKAGKNVTGFLVGQCMKASKGQGNPQIINKLIASELAKL